MDQAADTLDTGCQDTPEGGVVVVVEGAVVELAMVVTVAVICNGSVRDTQFFRVVLAY